MNASNTVEFHKITYKDIENYMNVSERTAKRYFSDIKEEYNLRAVCLQHFLNYFNLKEVPKSAK